MTATLRSIWYYCTIHNTYQTQFDPSGGQRLSEFHRYYSILSIRYMLQYRVFSLKFATQQNLSSSTVTIQYHQQNTQRSAKDPRSAVRSKFTVKCFTFIPALVETFKIDSSLLQICSIILLGTACKALLARLGDLCGCSITI